MTPVSAKEKEAAQRALGHMLGEDKVRKQEQAILDDATLRAEAAKKKSSQYFSNMLHEEHQNTLKAFHSGTLDPSTPSPSASKQKPKNVYVSRTPPIEMSNTFRPGEWAALIGAGATICLPLACIAVKLLGS